VNLDLDLSDPRQVVSEFVAVLVRRSAEFVEVELLVEAHVFGGALLAARVAGVEEALVVRGPGEVAEGRAAVDAGNHDLGFLARLHVEHVNVAQLTAGLREGHRDELAVPRRDEPVDRGRSTIVEITGVAEHASVAGLVGGG
jgi:hypothetical protein